MQSGAEPLEEVGIGLVCGQLEAVGGSLVAESLGGLREAVHQRLAPHHELHGQHCSGGGLCLPSLREVLNTPEARKRERTEEPVR